MDTCFCWSGPPDWNAITAISTAVLAVGVVIALYQLLFQRQASRVLETGRLLTEWKTLALSMVADRLDQDPDHYDRDRARALRMYRHITRLSQSRRFRRLKDATNDVIEASAQLAERIEIYVRKGAADEGIVAEHLGYDVLSSYQILRDVLQLRANDDDLSYEGFRDLALRIQDYAIVHPLDADLRGSLVWDPIPPLEYHGGDRSLGYKKTLWRKVELEAALIRDTISQHTSWAQDRAESERRYYTG